MLSDSWKWYFLRYMYSFVKLWNRSWKVVPRQFLAAVNAFLRNGLCSTGLPALRNHIFDSDMFWAVEMIPQKWNHSLVVFFSRIYQSFVCSVLIRVVLCEDKGSGVLRSTHVNFVRTCRGGTLAAEILGSYCSDVGDWFGRSILAEKFAVSQVRVGEGAVVV